MKKTTENRDVLALQEISSRLCNLHLGEHPNSRDYLSLLKAVVSLYYSFHTTEAASASSDTVESSTSSSKNMASMPGDKLDSRLMAAYSALFPQKLKIPIADIFFITQVIKNDPESAENDILLTAWNLFLQANDMTSYELSLDDFFENFNDETFESKEQLVETLVTINKFETEAEFKSVCVTLLKCATDLYSKFPNSVVDALEEEDRIYEMRCGNLFSSKRIILPAALTSTVSLVVINHLESSRPKMSQVISEDENSRFLKALKIVRSWAGMSRANDFIDLSSTSLTKPAFAYIDCQKIHRQGEVNYPHKFIELANELKMLNLEDLTEVLPQWLNKLVLLMEDIRRDLITSQYNPEKTGIVLPIFREILQRMGLPILEQKQITVISELIEVLFVLLTDHRNNQVERAFSEVVSHIVSSYGFTLDSRHLISDAIEEFLQSKVHLLLTVLRDFQYIFGFESRSHFSDMSLALIVKYLNEAPHVDSLDLSCRLNTVNDADWQSVCTAFERMTHLTSLDLRNNDFIIFSDSKWQTLCKSIQATPHLTVLRFTGNSLELTGKARQTLFIQALESHFNFTDIALFEDEATYTPESFEINQCIDKILSRNVIVSNSKKMAEVLLLAIPSYQAALKKGSPLALTQITETTLEMLTSALALLEACTGSEADAYRTRFQQQHDEIAFRVASILSTCNESGKALEYYQDVSSESPNYNEARLNAFLIVVMNYLSDPDHAEVEPKIRARNAVLSALPLCLDARDQLISFERLSMSDFDGFLLRAVGIPEKDVINAIGSVTKELRVKLFQYLMLIDLKEVLFSRQSQVQTDFFQKEQLGGLKDKLTKLPSVSSIEDFAKLSITDLLQFTKRRLEQAPLPPEADLCRRFRMAVFPVDKTDAVDNQLDI